MSDLDGVVELIDLRRSFGSTVALDGLSFTVPPGQVFGFLGPNGAARRLRCAPSSESLRLTAEPPAPRALARHPAELKDTL